MSKIKPEKIFLLFAVLQLIGSLFQFICGNTTNGFVQTNMALAFCVLCYVSIINSKIK